MTALRESADLADGLHRIGGSAANVAAELRRRAAMEQLRIETERDLNSSLGKEKS